MLLALAVFAGAAFAQSVDVSKLPPPAQTKIDFIRDVQPILSQHCYSCHGADKQENDLRWDVKSIGLKGGLSGPAIVPGNSSGSRMIHLVAGLDKNLVMPRRGERLTTQQISLLRAWIDQGAHWPDDSKSVADPKADWWSFKPAARPVLPTVENRKWARNPVDLFVLAKLEAEKMSPSPEADRRTLIRRLSFDLTGLPPTPDEVEAFLRDKSKQAYEKLVDRLLASPRYGERWARHWLDTVHYGETHGYDKDKPRLNAWPYRDYVIRALNEDKPYSRFVEEQLAGDVLFPGKPEAVVALGFIAAGPWDYVGHVELPIEKTDGLIARYNDRDDMVMTTISTFQSLTVHCARCHNHKFDPITQKDYYSLQAVFAGVDRDDRDFDTDGKIYARRAPLLAERKEVRRQLWDLTNHLSKATSPEIEKVAEQIVEVQKAATSPPDENSPSNGYQSRAESRPDCVKWVQVDLGRSLPLEEVRLIPARPVDFPETPGFGFPVRFKVEISEDADFSSRRVVTNLTRADFKNPGRYAVPFKLEGRRGRYVRVTVTKLWERWRDYVFALSELQVFVNGTNAALGAGVSSRDSTESRLWSGKFLVDGFNSRRKVTSPEVAKLDAEVLSLRIKRGELKESQLTGTQRTELARLRTQLAAINAQIAQLPPPKKVYAATGDFEAEENFLPPLSPRPVHLLVRGDVKRPGDPASAGGIACVPGPDARFKISDVDGEGARRAALARWLTAPQNLLTRRSIVNRVWHHHFGRGIVETPNDFGHMGAAPTHPELLDWLAFWFQDNGESLKKLHRLIVTSATYRQNSAGNPAFNEQDADNRFLWRMSRTRLDAEAIRDSMLLVSGRLDLRMGGPSALQFGFMDDYSPVYDYLQFDPDSPAGRARSIYRFIVRSVPDPLMDSLDCPDASVLSPKRNVTLTALQALAVLNNPFVLKQCEHLAARVARAGSVENQIRQVYQLALNRAPTGDELQRLTAFARENGMTNLCRLVFNTSEFMFVD